MASTVSRHVCQTHTRPAPGHHHPRSQRATLTWQKHQHAAPLRHELGARPVLVPVKT